MNKKRKIGVRISNLFTFVSFRTFSFFTVLRIQFGWGFLPKMALFLILFGLSNEGFSQNKQPQLDNSNLKMMSLEELMNIEVVSISMRPEKLTEVPSAVQVITNEDIQRSGAQRVVDALRLAPNLQIAQVNSHDWSVTSRGFSGLPTSGGILSNKLLVMIDGRSIYSPLFGGVYWDVQNLMLKDVEQIEIVSGPGGTLWGANAVNGVINIVSKSAKETQGIYVAGIGGSYLQNNAEIRYGGKLDSNLYFRVYGQRFDQPFENSQDTVNRWKATQGGFRMDYFPSNKNIFTLQGDLYDGNEKQGSKYAATNGQNILARFSHTFSRKSNLKIQVYFDRTDRNTPEAKTPFNYELTTYDLDIQYRFPVGNRQSILVGGGYRYMQDLTNINSFSPKNRTMPLATAFIQDEISCLPDLLKLTIGTKVLNNVYTGMEWQPSARLTLTPNKLVTVWSSVSRSVRTPSRFDSDLVTTQGTKLTPDDFKSEKVIAYELGYRLRPIQTLSFSLATYFNQYSDLRSLNTSNNPGTPTIISNGQDARSWGIEFSGNLQLVKWWRIRGGFTTFNKEILMTEPSVLPSSEDFEGVDPDFQFTVQSIMDLSNNFSLDIVGRFVDKLNSKPPLSPTSEYYSMDVRFAWHTNHFEIAIVGQNLLQDKHFETGVYQIPRSVYGKISYQF